MDSPHFMSLNKSLPKLSSPFDLISDSSGIIGGGGPVGFFSSVRGGERGEAYLSAPRSLLNQPLDRLALRESAMLVASRLGGRALAVLTSSPSAYALLRRPRLNRRRMLPDRDDKVGDAGYSSAGRLTPVVAVVTWGFAASALPLLAVCPSFGVSGGVGTLSSGIGDGRGGGMSVPSVNESKLKLRAGSSKRLLPTAPVPTDLTAVESFLEVIEVLDLVRRW